MERVVAVDAPAGAHRFSPDLLLNFAVHFPRARGDDAIAEVLAYADRRAGPPMETRLRLLRVFAGLPRPQAQWAVQDERARRAVWLDLAHPEHMIGIEYEGGGHTTPEGVLRDVGRGTDLVDKGWRLYSYTTYEVLGEPRKIVARITRALDATRSTSAGSSTSRTPLTWIS